MLRSILPALIAAAVLHTTPAVAATCDALASLPLPNARITSATSVAAGAFALPGRGAAPVTAVAVAPGNAPNPYVGLPAFCRVTATLTPSRDSDIKIEVWLPEAASWNGKFQAVGNGGWAGAILYNALAAALAGGYATANTDTGHVGGTAAFALGHPEKVTDMAYRAVHEMTVQAKTLVNAYYGSAPKLSFWNGCSLGGRQGITEALRYPADFDAIVAGAPAVNWMDLHVGRMALHAGANASADAVVPPSKYALIHDAALAACDGLDGVKDGVIGNPMSCRFDPAVLSCRAGQDPASCLSAPQVASVKALYAPVKNPATGDVLLPGLEPGSELSFQTIGGVEPLGTVLEAQKYVIHKDANWDFRTSTLAGDLQAARLADPDDALSSSSTSLEAFFARGGKLLMYHGFQDPQVPPQNSVRYYTKVVSGAGKGLEGKQIALYMVPGMNHCAGGPGTDTFDKMAAIESWVATGKAPESIAAAHRSGGVARTRPLCQYPKVAKWRGSGSTDEAANFSCVLESSSPSTR
jgi:feruloyl esterase